MDNSAVIEHIKSSIASLADLTSPLIVSIAEDSMSSLAKEGITKKNQKLKEAISHLKELQALLLKAHFKSEDLDRAMYEYNIFDIKPIKTKKNE